MNTIRFAFRDIIATLKERFSLVFVIALGIAAALMTHLITFGFMEREVLSRKAYSYFNTVSAFNIDTFDEELYKRIAERDDVENAFCFFRPYGEEYLLVGWLGSTPQKWFPIGEGNFLSDVNIDKPAYISGGLGMYRPGEQQKLRVMGDEYEIIGSTFLLMFNLLRGLEPASRAQIEDMHSFVFIRLDELTKMDVNDACVRVHFKYENDMPAKDFKKAAEEIFGAESSSAIMPPSPLKEFMAENIMFFVSIGLICLLAYMNIIAMYRHLLLSDMRKYQICSIIGAKRKMLFSVVLIKYLALFASAFVLSVITAILVRPLFARIRIEYVLNFKTLAAVFMFELSATLMVSLRGMIETVSAKNFRKNLLRRGNG